MRQGLSRPGVIVFSLLLAGAVLGMLEPSPYLDERPTKACFPSQMELSSAIGRYNVEKKTTIQERFLRGSGSQCIPVPPELVHELVSAKVLETPPACPGAGPDSKPLLCITNFGSGTFCFEHGTPGPAFLGYSTPAREQLREHGVTDSATLAAAWDRPAPGWEKPRRWWTVAFSAYLIVCLGACLAAVMRVVGALVGAANVR